MQDFRLTAREKGVGGNLRAGVSEEVAPQLGPAWLVYIHGFRVPSAKAEEQWNRLRALLALDCQAAGLLQAGMYLWPSDKFGKLNPLSYPMTGWVAKAAGRMLGDYLVQRAANRAVLVGHSLGALVAIEAANRLRGEGRLLHGLVLLGAAVESHELSGPGQFGTSPLAEREAVGYSPIDATLQRWFPRGEWLRALYDPHSDAIGLHGHPADRDWTAKDSRSEDHSYWDQPFSADLTNSLLQGRVFTRIGGWQPATHTSSQPTHPVGRWSS
jgi:pimeloyl-ACP methyl ester carboxylesterase